MPMAEGLMVDVAESEVVIDSLMEQLPGLFSETRETETILGPVIQVHSLFLFICLSLSHLLSLLKKHLRLRYAVASYL